MKKTPAKSLYRQRNCSSIAVALLIQHHHSDRLEKYAKVKQISFSKAVHEIMMLHKTMVNVAEYMSEVIGESHQKYKTTLMRLGEHIDYIR